MRLQLALNVRDLDEAIDFYSKMFGATPHKRKPGYANFALDTPPLKLVLFEAPDADERINHLGVEVTSADEVGRATERLRQAGLDHLIEDQTTCCYAESDKVWAREPQGLRWEWYRVLADSETFGDGGDLSALEPTDAEGGPATSSGGVCCAETPSKGSGGGACCA